MSIQASEFIWQNGEMKPWQQATVHVLSHALHYGSSIFEGIRSYETPDGTMLFRVSDHVERMLNSARIYQMPVAFGKDEIVQICHDVVAINGLSSAYIRPLFYFGYGSLGVVPSKEMVTECTVAAFQWGAYLGEDGLKEGVDVGVSSWQRMAPNTFPAMAKAGGNYLSSRLISQEAKRLGYREGIALDVSGFVSEGPGENLFAVKDGVIRTPSLHHSVLDGITRDTVMKLAKAKGYEVIETTLPREYLYLADELFFTGTAAELVPIRSVDGIQIGNGSAGAVTMELQDAFFGLFNGKTTDQWGWLSPLKASEAHLDKAV